MDLTRYLPLFVTDAREHLAALETNVVRLESDDPNQRAASLDAVFRALHSIKGSAATMGLDAVTRLAHATETLVSSDRGQSEGIDPDHVDLLLEATDALRTLVNAAAEGRDGEPPAELLQRLVSRPADDAEGQSPGASSQPPLELPPGPHTLARVRVSSRSATPAARAFVALRRLESIADVVATQPSREALRKGQLPDQTLTVVLRGTFAPELLTAVVDRLPDIDGVDVGPAASPAPAPARPAPLASLESTPSEQVIRVRVELLDQLLELAGELVLAAARLRERVRTLEPAERDPLEEETDRLRLLVKELSNRVLVARQSPVQKLADRLPRAVRDLSRRLGKPLELSVDGADVTMDRGLLEALADPLLHALRNAADHGIESPEERVTKGKPAAGHIAFAARRERERIVVELRDDGRGFDLDRLRRRAIERGALSPEEAGALSEEATLRLAFLPGLSTRDIETDVSGRGVGMDAVLRAIEQLGGEVFLSSDPGRGSHIRFSLPATVSVANLLLVSLGGEVFGVPMPRVLCAVQAEPDAQLSVAGERVAAFGLGRLLGLPEDWKAGPRPFVVVEAEGQRTAVGVDRLLGQEEAVLRPAAPPLERIRGLAGTAILGSGRPIFVLDIPQLVA